MAGVVCRKHPGGGRPVSEAARRRLRRLKEVSKVARNWREVRAEAVDNGLIDPQRADNARKEMHEMVRAYRLADIRKAQGPRQADVAKALGVSQARVSKLERGDLQHTELGTLESYVAALGGRLRVVADFGDDSITLQ
ncbi:XRE family transcriptional regulator [Rhodococcus sp. ZPP]|nr:XRE family transcriptional regulator [Rhodococcus sp. ZPP]